MLMMAAAAAAAAALLAAMIGVSEAVLCDDCVQYSGQRCVSYGTCQGVYCLYEFTTQLSSGQQMLKKSCVNTVAVQFDDGTQLTTYNQCVTKTTSAQSYVVKMCNANDYCNRECTNPVPLPPVATGVSCYSCTSTNGADCNSGSCTGRYCTYYLQQSQTTGATQLKKGCADTAQFILDDGSLFSQTLLCQTVKTTGYSYNLKICNSNYCNGYCTPDPQRDPSMSCYSCVAQNADDCTGPVCQGSYCTYEKTTPSNGVSTVRRSCSLTSYLLYPDNQRTTTVNQCESRTIGDTRYAIEVCNSGNFCGAACKSGALIATVLPLLSLLVIALLKL